MKSKPKKDPYATLGVKPDASPDEIRKAHRRRARQTHPDAQGDAEEFKDVQAAYLTLIDPDARRRYEETGETADEKKPPLWHVAMVDAFAMVLAKQLERKRKPKHLDMCGMTIEFLEMQMINLGDQVQKAAATLADIREAQRRLREPAGPLLATLIDKQIAAVEADMTKAQELGEASKQAVAYLKKCKYEHETARRGSGGMWGGVSMFEDFVSG